MSQNQGQNETGVDAGIEAGDENPQVQAGEVNSGEGEGQAQPQPQPPALSSPPAAPKSDWRDKRIDKLTRQLAELRKAQEAGQSGAGAQAEAVSLESQIERRAQELAARREYDSRCMAAVNAGHSELGKEQFNSRIAAIHQLVDKYDKDSMAAYDGMIAGALEFPSPHRIIAALGEDLDETSRILGLSPAKQAIELAKLSRKLEEASGEGAKAGQGEQAPPALPKPVKPVGKGSGESIRPDDPSRQHQLSTREWMERRNAQAQAQSKVRR